MPHKLNKLCAAIDCVLEVEGSAKIIAAHGLSRGIDSADAIGFWHDLSSDALGLLRKDVMGIVNLATGCEGEMAVPKAIGEQVFPILDCLSRVIQDLIFSPDIESCNHDIRDGVISHYAGIPIVTGGRAMLVSPSFAHGDLVVDPAGAVISGVSYSFTQENHVRK